MALEVCCIDWHINPARADKWFAIWEPAAARALSFGAKDWSITRNTDDILHFRQSSTWESRTAFDRYWYSDEIQAYREEAINYFHKPLLPNWHQLVGSDKYTLA